MAEIKVPIKIDFSYVILDILRRIETDRDDYMYMQGFYDCRDTMISTIENFLDRNMNDDDSNVDKYVWHDIRKNPDDLPQDISDVLIASDDGELQIGYYCGERFAWELYNPDRNMDWEYVEAEEAMVNVIAWKYIESFKEDK